jgi:hypothetical protein
MRRIAPQLVLICLLSLLAGPGCTRMFWRKQADCESLTLIDKGQFDPRWQILDYRVYPDRRSRFYDPFSPDYPPLPFDDPAAHRLMHCVDCKQGFPCWHRNGDNPNVENPDWQNYLPLNENGQVILDLQNSIELAYIHSRDYQNQLEDVYLSALDVTFERFRFDVQFFTTNNTNFFVAGPLRSPPNGSSLLTTSTDPGFRRMFASGGQLAVDFANSVVWQFAGPNTNVNTTFLNLGFVQPFLRGAGRARVLERLTFAERTLLYNVREMARYQQGMYVQLYTGRSPGQGPQRRGGTFGGAGLQGFSGVGAGGFGRVGGVGTSGPTGGVGVTGGAGAAQANGYLGLLQDAMQIQNLEANVNGLRDSLAQLEAAYDAGRIDRFQVDLARQALFNAQSRLLTARAAYQTSLDSYKFTLGLPPHTEVVVEDPLLEEFEILQPELLEVQQDIGKLLDGLRSPAVEEDAPVDPALLEQLIDVRRAAAARFGVIEDDFKRLDERRQTRIDSLGRLREQIAEENVEVGDTTFSPEAFEKRRADMRRDYQELLGEFEKLSQGVLALGDQANAGREQAIGLGTDLSSVMERLLLLQARVRLDAITLQPIDLDPRDALRIASRHRLDWMNSRAGLVDQWRLIEFNANDLRSRLDLVVDGDLGTVGDNPAKFRGTNGSLRVGLQFDAPFAMIAERNIYRQSVIEFLQARRAYMAFVDSIDFSVRSDLRTIELNLLNFELRRAAVFIAIDQVDITSLRLRQPPRPGEQSVLGVTAARDLVDSLGNLLNVQNDFLSVWVNYELQRVNLDFDLGTMMIDDRGMWVDPGSFDKHLDSPGEEVPHALPSEIMDPRLLPAGDEAMDQETAAYLEAVEAAETVAARR